MDDVSHVTMCKFNDMLDYNYTLLKNAMQTQIAIRTQTPHRSTQELVLRQIAETGEANSSKLDEIREGVPLSMCPNEPRTHNMV
jgi:hypothetical protein